MNVLEPKWGGGGGVGVWENSAATEAYEGKNSICYPGQRIVQKPTKTGWKKNTAYHGRKTK